MWGGSPTGWQRSREASTGPKEAGSHPSYCVSKASFFCCRALPEPQTRWRMSSGRLSMGRVGRRRYLGSCAPRRASLAYCGIRNDPPTPSPASSRSMTDLPKASALPILSPRNSCWTSWAMPITTEPSATTDGGTAISFGPFRLLPAQRLLLEGDQPVRLGNRAFDILATLLERASEVVGKEELIARAWPKTFVEDANLKIQISALRRALGDGQGGNRYITTITGRGYNFVAPVRFEKLARAPPPATIASAAAHNLPLAMTRMIGREEVVATLVSRVSRERVLTIVGPGGIGKTTVALAVAERIISDYEHGVWLIDLSPLGDPRLVPSAVATVLGLEVRTENPLPGLIAALRDRRMLLLLDSCEHVIDAAASLAAAVLSGVPRVNILATSREPLGVAGEPPHRLGPLRSPPPSP